MNRLIIGIVAILAAIAIFFVFKQEDEGSMVVEDIEFAVEDIAAIDRISMRDRDGNAVDLRKQEDGSWMVNQTYPAFQPVVNLFLEKTLSKIAIKGAAPLPAKDNIIRGMIVESVKVDIFSGKDNIKSYYVGGYTPDMKGTYMHMKGSKDPFITYIPGFDGFLSPRYSLDPLEWYSKVIFDYKAEDIAEVVVIHHTEPGQSFHLVRKGEKVEMKGGGYDPKATLSYLALFKFKNFEGYATYLNEAQKDSIASTSPLMTVKVQDLSGAVREMQVYRKGNDGGNTLVDKTGNVLAYDPERYFASFTDFDQLVSIQRYTFGKILVKREDFRN
jgi:hypothetical protein